MSTQSQNLAVAMKPSEIFNVATMLPANIAILIKGPTGVGKSFMAQQVADHFGYPLIDVRGSTMDEAGVTGIPDFERAKELGVTYFLATSWFKRACDEPVVLFLDEMNRSMQQVMQSFFQIVLDRALGNDETGAPRLLHPETRVLSAINAGNEYDVNEIDPALLRRFWVCEYDIDAPSWLDWASSNGISRALQDFIRVNPGELRVDPSTVEPGKVCPNPASWDRCDTSLRHMGMNPDDFIGKRAPQGFYHVCCGFVGTESASKFLDHLKSMKSDVSAEDVLYRWKEVKDRVDRSDAAMLNKLHDRIVAHLADDPAAAAKEISSKCGQNLYDFCEHAGGEITILLWKNVSGMQSAELLKAVHEQIKMLVVQAAQAGNSSK